jgi:hypothetical protein
MPRMSIAVLKFDAINATYTVLFSEGATTTTWNVSGFAGIVTTRPTHSNGPGPVIVSKHRYWSEPSSIVQIYKI